MLSMTYLKVGCFPTALPPPAAAAASLASSAPYCRAGRLRGSSRFRKPHTALRRYAATMHWLASGAHLHVVGELFGISTAAMHKHTHAVVAVMKAELVGKNIKFPSGAELDQVMIDFEYLGLPQCAGAIDGCFIEMKKPPGVFSHKYWCYKNLVAILLLAVVDARGVFTYITAANPSSVGDAQTFHNTTLKEKLMSGEALPHDKARSIQGVAVRPYIVGDAAFPFMSFLMKGYDGDYPPRSKQAVFNSSLIRCRQRVESAFGRLKGRWRVLTSRNFRDPDFMADITEVCCALHNMCETRQLEFDNSLYEHPAERGGYRDNNEVDSAAASIREALAAYVSRARIAM